MADAILSHAQKQACEPEAAHFANIKFVHERHHATFQTKESSSASHTTGVLINTMATGKSPFRSSK